MRAILGPDKIIGVSAQTVEQAVLAEKNGADYLGVGAVFHTGTKKDANSISHETVKQICEAVNIPVIAIGGISVKMLWSFRVPESVVLQWSVLSSQQKILQKLQRSSKNLP